MKFLTNFLLRFGMRFSGPGKNRSLSNFAIVFLFSCLGTSGCKKTQTEITPDMRMAAMLFSRSSVDEVKVFREKTYIHGLSFFYFHLSADDVGRVVTWLKMKERNSIPPLLSDRILAASTGTDWKFKWDEPKIYVTFYCHPFDGTYWSVDMLLVNNGEAVFVTEGYLPPGSYVTDDPSLCETPKN